ncbi:MAG: choice-of-anchor A family protein [Cyanobacteria bacterium J06632_22]
MQSFFPTKLSTPVHFLAGAAAVATVSWAGPTWAFSLGSASDYNVFVLGDYDMQSTDIWGKLAVGGSFTADTFGVGTQLRGDSHGTTLAVGGDVTLSNGKVYGDAVYGGNADVADNVGFEFLDENNRIIRRASLTQASSLDFGAIGTELKSIAQSVSQSAAGAIDGVMTEVYGDVSLVTLKGSDTERNIFNLTGDLFSSLRKLTFDVPDTAEIIVNVSGSSANISDFDFYLGDESCGGGSNARCLDRASNVLFNFADAELLDITRVGFIGSILAPKADVDFNNGHINGTLVAGSLSGTGESHLVDRPDNPNNPGNPGNPDEPASVPEPTALAGLALLGLSLRRLKRSTAAT